MLIPPPVPPGPEPETGYQPKWSSRDWGEVRRPVRQLLLAPFLTIALIHLWVWVGLPAFPWTLIPMAGPTTAVAIMFNRRGGIALMWPLLAIETFLALWGYALLFWV